MQVRTAEPLLDKEMQNRFVVDCSSMESMRVAVEDYRHSYDKKP